MSEKKTNISSNNVSVTPNGKKLIQARLPFKTLASTPKVGIDSLGAVESRKRKLSNTEDENRSTKLSKTSGTKENIKKKDDITVLEMVDLVEDDIVMTDNEKFPTADLLKLSKKSTKGADVDEKDVQLRRSSRKHDSEVPTKVVIKIPSAKKKKVNERHVKVIDVAKIDEDDDDDVIPIDSEENSLTSVDDKEKGPNDNADLSIVLIEDDNSFVSVDKDPNSKVDVNKVADTSTTVDAKNVSQAGTVESIGISLGKDANVSTASVKDNVPEQNATNKMSQSKSLVAMETDDVNVSNVQIDSNKLETVAVEDEKQVSPCNTTTSSEGNHEADDNNDEAKTNTDLVSTPATSTVERRTRKSIDNSLMSTPKTPASKPSDSNVLTPKQLQKRLESEQKRLAKEKAKEDRERKLQEAKEERERKIQEAKEERERKLQEAKEERERKLQEEKEQKQRERDEKERQKKKERDDKEEQKRKEREDKEEQRRKEKEEREKKKQAEIDAKNEEKRQKEEEKVAKEEAEMKKKRKEAEAFTKFFAKKSNKSAESDKMDVDEGEANFMPFRVKHDMRLAPIVRRKLSPTTKSNFDDEVLNSTHSPSSKNLYIQSLRNGSHLSEKQGKTWPNEDNNDELLIIDDLENGTPIEEASAIQKYRAKFFKFEENRRPPYYGTWQKKSTVITPRRPFKTDQKFFDYEVDSDDEWEDEEPGESLHGSDDEKDKESDDDYDIDNEFFVPHGHLSDEELANNDEIDDDNSPDTQKAKLKIMQKVFSDEMKKKTEKIKPRLIGLIWQNKDGSQPQVCPNVIWEMLQMRSMIFNGASIVIPITHSVDKNDALDENSESKKGSAIKKRVKLTEEGVSDLLRLVHGNTNSGEFLSKEFRAFTAQKNKDNEKFQEFSLASIRMKMKELAEWKPCPDDGPLLNKNCWYVSMEQRKHYNMEDLPIENNWNYILTPKSKPKTESKKAKESDKGKSPPEASDEVSSVAAKTPKSKLGNIEKFTKILSDDDKKKNFSIPIQEPPETSSPMPKPNAEPSPKPTKKRVKLLMSVPRGQEIPVQTKNSLISQYLSGANSNKKSTDKDEPICID